MRRDERESGLADAAELRAHARPRDRGARALPRPPARRGGRDRHGLRGGALRGARLRAARHRGAPRGAVPARSACRPSRPASARSAYLAALRVDKKKQDARIHFVVLEGVGSARTVPLLPSEVRGGAAGAAARGAARVGAGRASARPPLEGSSRRQSIRSGRELELARSRAAAGLASRSLAALLRARARAARGADLAGELHRSARGVGWPSPARACRSRRRCSGGRVRARVRGRRAGARAR